MTVTNSYKTVTFSNAEGFAVVRALRTRIDELTAALAAVVKEGGTDTKYLDAQLAAARSALTQFRNTPYLVGPRLDVIHFPDEQEAPDAPQVFELDGIACIRVPSYLEPKSLVVVL